jgi:tape measure domain-containing protein
MPIVAGGILSARSAMEMERLEMGLAAVSGSADDARIQLARLKVLAQEPGLGFREAIRGSINLQAIGISAERSERALRGFGRAVALTGGGAAELDRIFVQLGQSASRGRVLAADWNPIIQTAPAVSAALRELFGTVDPQEIEARGMSFDAFFDAIVAKLEELPPAGGGAAKAFEDFADASFRARAAIGDQLLPAIVPLVEGLASTLENAQKLNPETVRMGLAIAGAAATLGPATTATFGFVRALAAARTASMGLAATLGPAGLAIVGVSLLSGWLIKNKLDALAAAGAVDQFRASLDGLSRHALTMRSAALIAQEEALRAQMEEAKRLRGEASPEYARAVVEHRKVEEELKRIVAHYNALGPETRTVANNTKLTKEELERAMRVLQSGAAGASLLGTFGLNAALASEPLRKAVDAAVKLKEEADAAAAALAKLGAQAPAGAAEHVAELRRHATEARAEVERLAREWGAALTKFAAPFKPTTTDSRGGIITSVFPAPEQIEREHARVTGHLNELYARGLIDKKALEKGGTDAGRQFNAALLRYLATAKLAPEVRAKIQAMLKLDLDVEKGAGWQDAATGAATVAQGMVNVADAFGRLDDKSRRALTGVSELTRSLGGLDMSKSLFSGANLTNVVGAIGGLAQLASGVFGESEADRERRALLQKNNEALDALRLSLSGFRLTGETLERALKVATAMSGGSSYASGLRGQAKYGPLGELGDLLASVGMSWAEFKKVAAEVGIELREGVTLSRQEMEQLAEQIRLSGVALTGWRNTVDDARRARDLEAKLGGVDLSDPVRKLESEFEIFSKFFQLPNVRDLDLSDAVDRDALREVLQTLYKQFAAGTLDLQGLTRDEFLSLFDSMADGLNGFDEAVKSATRGMLNVPPVFDLALRRRMAALDGALGGVATPPKGGAVQPGDGWQPPKEITLSLQTLAADFGALSRPVEGAGAGLDRFAGLLAGMGAPLEGFAESIESAWSRLDRMAARVPAAPATVTSGSGGGAGGPTAVRGGDFVVHIHSPPAGMDVGRTTALLKDKLKYDPEIRLLVQRAGAG